MGKVFVENEGFSLLIVSLYCPLFFFIAKLFPPSFSTNTFPNKYASFPITEKDHFSDTNFNVNGDINTNSYNNSNFYSDTNIIDETNIHEYYSNQEYFQYRSKNENENENEEKDKNENENENEKHSYSYMFCWCHRIPIYPGWPVEAWTSS